MFRAMFISFAFVLSATSFASDGPENTGVLTLQKPSAHEIEAHLQIDNKIFKNIFGEDAQNPVELFLPLIQLKISGTHCTGGEPTVVANADVLSAVIVFDCPVMTKELTVNLQATESLPPGFTLGVRTPIDHFVMSAQTPTIRTIINMEYLFFRAGLGYFSGSTAVEKARLGRPHALFYGGLSGLPPGIWFLMLFLLIFSSRVKLSVKFSLSFVAVLVTGLTTGMILEKGASLSLLAVKPLGFTYLALLIAVGVLNILKPSRSSILAMIVTVLVAAICSGVEQAIVLRWLEGQQDINLAATLFAFFSGAAVTVCGILVVLIVIQRLVEKKWLKLLAFKHRYTAVNGLLILALLFPMLAMFFKLV